ncbi:C-type lectin domain family 2 member B-like [Lissotriton helveticus]
MRTVLKPQKQWPLVPPFRDEKNQLWDERGQTAGNATEDLMDGVVLPPCNKEWTWYQNKCFYFSEAEGTWPEAKDSCAALDSTLAMIDTQEELDFLLNRKGDPDYWIGLWRDSEKRWRWINGTGLSNWFKVADYSDYAYLNHHNVKSGDSYNTRHWICNKVSTYERKYKRKKTLPSFHRGI